MPLSEGMKIAPVVIQDRSIFISMGYKPENMTTFHSKVHGGRPYLVSFIEVPNEEYETYMKRFSSQIDEFFNGYGEGMNYKNSSYNTDDDEVSRIVSYEELLEAGYEGASVQSEAEVRLLYEDLLKAAKAVSKYYPSVIRLTIEGYSKKEIIKRLGFKVGSNGYRKIDEALKFALKHLTEE